MAMSCLAEQTAGTLAVAPEAATAPPASDERRDGAAVYRDNKTGYRGYDLSGRDRDRHYHRFRRTLEGRAVRSAVIQKYMDDAADSAMQACAWGCAHRCRAVCNGGRCAPRLAGLGTVTDAMLLNWFALSRA